MPIVYRLKVRTDGAVRTLGETNGTTMLVEGIEAGTHEVFATAVAADGTESAPSEAITFTLDEKTPPAPKGFRIAQ